MYGLIRWYYVIFLLYYSIEVCHGSWKILFDDVFYLKPHGLTCNVLLIMYIT